MIEEASCPNHIPMQVSIPLNLSVSQFVGYLKVKVLLKYKYGNCHFWCRSSFVDSTGRKKSIIFSESVQEYSLFLCITFRGLV